MKIKKIVCFLLSILLLAAHADKAYAQFWKNWFQKDKQAEEVVPKEKDKNIQPDNVKEELPKQESQKPLKGESFIDVKIRTIGKPQDTPEQATERAEQKAQEKARPLKEPKQATQLMDDKQKEEELRRTQEQVDQIKKVQEMNNTQRSLDNIRRINEMNQQQKRINEINKLNKMQKNLDESKRAGETKK